MLHKSYQSCEELDYSNYPQQRSKHSPQIPHKSKQHSPCFQQTYAFSPSPSFQTASSNNNQKINIAQRKLPQQPTKLMNKNSNRVSNFEMPVDQQFAYVQSNQSCSMANLDSSFHDPNQFQDLSSQHSPNQSIIKSPDLESGGSNLVLKTFRNDKNSPSDQQFKQQSIYGTNSRKHFASERSHSMLDASHFQLKKHPNFLLQQQSIANELKEKQKLKQQKNSNEFLLPMYQVKEKAKSRELLSDEPSEDDTLSSGLSG